MKEYATVSIILFNTISIAYFTWLCFSIMKFQVLMSSSMKMAALGSCIASLVETC